MKVRTRLVLAFAYILLTVIVALTVPLAFNLRARAASELVGQAKVTAQALAAVIDVTKPSPPQSETRSRLAPRPTPNRSMAGFSS